MNTHRHILSLFSVLIAIVALILPGIARADGMVIPPLQTNVWESGQRAVLFYEDATQTETLVVSMQFRGDADDFAWIIPVPGNPTVSRGSETLFSSLDELTESRYTVYSYDEIDAIGGMKTQPVNVVNTQSIDYYDVTTLTANDSTALSDWLNENGYYYPSASSYVFNGYVTNGWYFVAVKINAESAGAFTSQNSKLRDGTIIPLKFVFQAPNPVYPLKISSVMSDVPTQWKAKMFELQSVPPPYEEWRPATVPVELYVIASHKKAVSGFSTSYGDWVKKKTIESWAVDEQGDPLLQPSEGKYFLTRLNRNLAYADMTEDIFPQDADNNKKVNMNSSTTFSFEHILLFLLAISLYTALVFFIGMFSPFGIAFILATVLYLKARSRAGRVTAWVIQSFVGAVYALVSLFLILASFWENSSIVSPLRSMFSGSDFYSTMNPVWVLTLVIPVLAFLGLVIVVMVFQRRWRKKREQCCLPENKPLNS